MNNFLLWFGGLLVALLAALFAAPSFVDWNSYRGVFEEEATRVLGRKMRVGGSVNLRLLPVPYVRFEKVRIADDTGTLGAPFFGAEAFTLWLSVPPLVKGVIEAKQVELERPVLNLAVDNNGAGNWNSFKLASGSLPFVPSDVALQSMKITEGRISLRFGGDTETLVLSGLNGEFSADALAGPYRFRGDVSLGGRPHELRLTTGATESDGSVRIKAIARSAADDSTYIIDGSAADFGKSVRFTGEFTARVPLAGSSGRPAIRQQRPGDEEKTSEAGLPEDAGLNSERSAQAEPARPNQGGADLKAKLALGVKGFEMDDIVMSFEGGGAPQLITGSASGTWQGEQKLGVALAARWLDIDKITALSGATTPFEVVRQMGEQVFARLPADWDSEARLTIDQANLAGDAVGEIVVDLLRRRGQVPELRQFAGALPGGARFRTSGQVLGKGDEQYYSGRVTIYGSSLTRFVVWASRGSFKPEARTDRSFSITGNLAVRKGGFELTEAAGEMARQQLSGSLVQSWLDTGSLALTLAGEQIDIAPFMPGLFDRLVSDPVNFARGLAGELQQVASAAEADWLKTYRGELKLDVSAGRIDDGGRALRNVDVRFTRAGGKLDISRLAWTTPEGLALTAEASVDGLQRNPRGTIKGWITAEGGAASHSLAEAIAPDLPATALLKRAVTNGGPFRAGFIARIDADGRGAVDTRVKGTLGNSQVQASLRLAGGLDRWRNDGIEASLDLSGNGLRGLVNALGHGDGAVAKIDPARSEDGRLTVRASGVGAEAIRLSVGIDSPELRGDLDGQVDFAEAGRYRLAGRLRVESGEVKELFGIMTPDWKSEIEQAKLSGIVKMDADERSITLKPEGLGVGPVKVSGVLQLAPGASPEDQVVTATGQLDVDWLALDSLQKLMLSGNGGPRESAPWPDNVIKFDVVDRLQSEITIRAGKVTLGGEHVLSAATARLKIRKAAIVLEDVTGQALGGRFSGKLAFDRQPLGVLASVTGKLEGAQVARVFAGNENSGREGDAVSSGAADMTFQLSGNGLSPRSIIGALAGEGSISTRNVSVPGLAADAVYHAASGVLAEGQEATETTAVLLDRQFKGLLAQGRLGIGTRRLPFVVADGVVRVLPFSVRGESGAAQNTTTVDLASLKVDSEWRISATKRLAGVRDGSAGGQSRLPPASVLYIGGLGQLGKVDKRVDTEALDRELTVLRIERSVETLERMRREGEEGARKEAQRLKALEAERRRMNGPAGNGGVKMGPQPHAPPAVRPAQSWRSTTMPPGGD